MKTPQPIHSPVRTLLHIQTRESIASSSDPSLPLLPSVKSLPILDFISSTATVDRYHEIIDPAGWHLDSYRRNPVFQNAHQYGDILFTLGKALITEVRSGPSLSDPLSSDGRGIKGEVQSPSSFLFQRIQFATDINPMARIAYGLYRGQFLNAVSVGFIPLRWQDADPDSRSTPDSDSSLATRHSSLNSSPSPRRKYLEQELLEVSAVAIPANPDALALAVKSGAVAKSDLADTLDLLRRLTIDYGPWRPSSVPPRTQLSTPNPQLLLNLARELRRILRRA